jgi:diguanylate cyclase (GGDEF)-like protein
VVIARASAIDVRRLVHGMRNAAIDARLIVAAPRPGGAARASLAHDDDGVDDWVGVPYNPREVLTRVRSQFTLRARMAALRAALAQSLGECEKLRQQHANQRQLIDALELTRADNRRLEALATTDPLTRTLNRRALHDRLERELDRARRFRSVFSVLLLDADNFKLINDREGHLVGDGVLRQLAALLEEDARSIDVVARYGGEEFAVILPETTPEGALTFSERLRERIRAYGFDAGAARPLHMTVSIGVTSYPHADIETVDDLLARADEALYRAKAGGRDRVCV